MSLESTRVTGSTSNLDSNLCPSLRRSREKIVISSYVDPRTPFAGDLNIFTLFCCVFVRRQVSVSHVNEESTTVCTAFILLVNRSCAEKSNDVHSMSFSDLGQAAVQSTRLVSMKI